ncbi:hypothetical protein BpHYR1_000574 [Brachionus plicatilis]|uniref:Uncharacterized protein n=1 Tax=Brachionus plicatilis TaxID=10195 RepID=A0A3M7T4Q2_BRAPC|nr:hypothetical protein BpHYR1_000574 [Brachionus plicatilis]
MADYFSLLIFLGHIHFFVKSVRIAFDITHFCLTQFRQKIKNWLHMSRRFFAAIDDPSPNIVRPVWIECSRDRPTSTSNYLTWSPVPKIHCHLALLVWHGSGPQSLL